MQPLKTGEIVRALRKNKDITQEQLAEVLGISAAAVSKWESGLTSPDIQLFPILARYFHVSIDFLMGFSNTASEEEREQIYNEVTNSIQSASSDEAIDIWEYYNRQYPNDYQMKYDLANIVLLNMVKLSDHGKKDLTTLTTRLINVYEQCTESDDLKIKQGSYYQISNLFITLQNYESAQKTLSKIPVQEVSPQLLLNMIYIRKGEYPAAEKSIQESILRAVNEIVGELGHLIVIRRQANNSDAVLQLLNKQRQLFDIFELTPLLGIGVILQIVMQLCGMGKQDEALSELEGLAQLVEQSTDRKSVSDIPFFSDIDTQDSAAAFNGMKSAYKMLLKNCLDQINDRKRVEEIKQRLEPFFNIPD